MSAGERGMSLGRDRTADHGGDCCTAEDHQATGSKNDRPATDTRNENRTEMASQ